ncbi:hypothetical protein HDU76_006364 [Blyttiomyces sp. JEL0837]|nr:hypothetical protein HDU76_006364 [Blyttiomyces sp. JEL0837]
MTKNPHIIKEVLTTANDPSTIPKAKRKKKSSVKEKEALCISLEEVRLVKQEEDDNDVDILTLDDDDDDNNEESVKQKSLSPFKKETSSAKMKVKKPKVPKDINKAARPPPKPRLKKLSNVYVPEEMRLLRLAFPDAAKETLGNSNIDVTRNGDDLFKTEVILTDGAQIMSMVISPCGSILVTFSTLGHAKAWDLQTYELLATLRDFNEENIEEFYTGSFVTGEMKIIVAGKLKDRKQWSEVDDDNHVLPCPLKMFDLETGKVSQRLAGHTEEVLFVDTTSYKGHPYILSTSQDGHIIKWKMSPDWSSCLTQTRFKDGDTCMAFMFAFLPLTGNRYFIAACDDHLKLFDMETSQAVQTFNPLYSCYCDCVKMVSVEVEREMIVTEGQDPLIQTEVEHIHAYVLVRGVELTDAENGSLSQPNTVTLLKLSYPTSRGSQFNLEEIRRYSHPDNRATRTWQDFESTQAALDSVIRLYEDKLKELNPTVKQINYEISHLYKFIDSMNDLAALVFNPALEAYQPYDKEWIKQKILESLKKAAGII